jgi:hypothetical protein
LIKTAKLSIFTGWPVTKTPVRLFFTDFSNNVDVAQIRPFESSTGSGEPHRGNRCIDIKKKFLVFLSALPARGMGVWELSGLRDGRVGVERVEGKGWVG